MTIFSWIIVKSKIICLGSFYFRIDRFFIFCLRLIALIFCFWRVLTNYKSGLIIIDPRKPLLIPMLNLFLNSHNSKQMLCTCPHLFKSIYMLTINNALFLHLSYWSLTFCSIFLTVNRISFIHRHLSNIGCLLFSNFQGIYAKFTLEFLKNV